MLFERMVLSKINHHRKVQFNLCIHVENLDIIYTCMSVGVSIHLPQRNLRLPEKGTQTDANYSGI